MARLLLTGGAGFIGSHTAVVLQQAGHQLVVLDNFSNSAPEALRRVEGITGQSIHLVKGDVRDPQAVQRALACGVDAVVHFAGLKAVGESVEKPLLYWDVNLSGSRVLLEVMRAAGCRTLVFSSSATVYGIPDQVPIPETAPVQPNNPYGQTKAAVEQMLADVSASEAGWRVACLRYFNPVGAHPSGQIGEDPLGIPDNLFPFVSQVAVGQRPQLNVFGGDWPTPDGTCLRDYIHVMDLAEGHRAALEVLLDSSAQQMTLNLGSGQGHSVLEVIQAFEKASGQAVPYAMVGRRPGDAASTAADPALAQKHLGWSTRRSLQECCRDSWAWQQANPNGYR